MDGDLQYGQPSENNDQNLREWASLPDLLLFSIAGRLNPIEYLALAGTCRPWRSFAKASAGRIFASHPPLLALVHPYLRRIGLCSIFDDASMAVFLSPITAGWAAAPSFLCVGYSHGYLIMCSSHPATNTTRVHLYQPFTRREISCCFPDSNHKISSAILSSPPSSPGCMIVAYSRRTLLYCRPGDAQWKEFLNPNDDFDMEMLAIAQGKKLYCLGISDGVVMAFDNILEPSGGVGSDPWPPVAETIPPPPGIRDVDGYALLTASPQGDLYLVSRLLLSSRQDDIDEQYDDFATRAFRYDDARKEWSAVKSFGGLSAFVTWHGSSLLDVDGPNSRKNGICCFPELGWYILDTEDFENFASRDETFGSMLIRDLWSWDASAFWVLPALCFC